MTRSIFISVCVAAVVAVVPCQAIDWRNPVRQAIRTTAEEVGKAVTAQPQTTGTTAQAPATGTTGATSAVRAVSASAGSVVFSTAPIDPGAKAAGQASFKAGDHIYALITVDKPWPKIIDGTTDSLLQLPVKFTIGTKELFQYIGIKKTNIIAGSTFALEIAPDVETMTAYRDPDITYPMCSSRTFGPFLFTDLLGKLPAGKHPIVFSVAYFGKTYATGTCEIEGADFSCYAAMNTAIKEVMDGTRGMPAAGKVDMALEAEMKKLCENAGWKDIARLVIVDKDWWIDYVNGSGTPVKSRHMAAAVAAKDVDGSYYYCTVTFHQPRLISGGFGALELTHTGMKNKITKDKIGK